VKVFEIHLDAGPGEAQKMVDDMCRRLLANPVIHNYSVTVR